MKLHTLFSAAALIGSLMGTSTAFAWTAYYLGNNKWAIECNNGHMYSYSGGSDGLSTVGPALCPGGLAGPGGDRPIIVRDVPAQVKRVVEGGCTPVFPLPRGVSNAKQCSKPKRAMQQHMMMR